MKTNTINMSSSYKSYNFDSSNTSNKSKNKINSSNNLLKVVPRQVLRSTSPLPQGIDPELRDAKKSGKDYHISVNLNSLLASNQLGTMNKKLTNTNTIINKSYNRSNQSFQKNGDISEYKTINQIVSPKNRLKSPASRNEFSYDSSSYRTNQAAPNFLEAGSSKSVIDVQGSEDPNSLIAYKWQQQSHNNNNTLHYQPRSFSVQQTPLQIDTTDKENISNRGNIYDPNGGFAIKSISQSEAKRQQLPVNTILRSDKLAFDLQLKSQIQTRIQTTTIPQPSDKKWEITGNVPIYQQTNNIIDSRSNIGQVIEEKPNMKSRGGFKELPEEDEVDNVKMPAEGETTKALVNLVLSHSLIKEPPENNYSKQSLHVQQDEERIIGPLSNQQIDGLINVDIVTEKVDVLLKDGQAHVVVQVRCERVMPIPSSEDLFRKSGVVAIKTIDIDLTLSDLRSALYEDALARQNESEEGKLSQAETFEVYRSLMQLTEADVIDYNERKKQKGISKTKNSTYSQNSLINQYDNTDNQNKQPFKNSKSYKQNNSYIVGNKMYPDEEDEQDYNNESRNYIDRTVSSQNISRSRPSSNGIITERSRQNTRFYDEKFSREKLFEEEEEDENIARLLQEPRDHLMSTSGGKYKTSRNTGNVRGNYIDSNSYY